MFKKIRKWIFWALLLVATGSAALHLAQKAARWIEKENDLLGTAGEEAAQAIRSVGEAGQTFLDRAGEEKLTLLFTGLSEDWRSPDAILLIAIDLSEGSVHSLSVDPAIYVHREAQGVTCIGDVYTRAYTQARKRSDSASEAVSKGNIALKGFLKENMGIAVDHYLSLNSAGLSALVEAVGGITVKLDEPLDYDDDARGLHVHLKSGEQTLSGAQASELVRLGNDYEEIDTQRLVLSAFFRKIKRESSLSSVFALLKESRSRTVSSLSLPDLFPLVRSMLNISSSQVKSAKLRGTPVAGKDECRVLCRAKAIELLAASLPGQSVDEDHFDRRRVFTSEGEADALYYAD